MDNLCMNNPEKNGNLNEISLLAKELLKGTTLGE